MQTSTRQPSLRGLRAFCLAADALSYRHAAEQLFVTPSAVSHQVKRLEEELGMCLFDRVGGRLVLTASGETLLRELREPLAAIDGAMRRLRARDTRSTLRLSIQPFFASEWFIPRLGAFTQAHPDIDLVVDTSDETLAHHPKGADVSIRLFRQAPRDLVAVPLFPLRLVPACAPDLAAAALAIVDGSVSGVPLIVHNTRADAWRQWLAGRGLQLPARQRLVQLDSMIAVVRAAERGLGVALVPMPLSEGWFASGAIVALCDEALATNDHYHLVYDRGSEKAAQIALLHDWVLQTFVMQA